MFIFIFISYDYLYLYLQITKHYKIILIYDTYKIYSNIYVIHW